MNCSKCGSGLGSDARVCGYCGTVSPVRGHRFVASAPLRTHWHKVSCKEVDCVSYLTGWTITLDVAEGSQVGKYTAQDMADWLRARDDLKFTEASTDTLITFSFAPGHECIDGILGKHKMPIGASVKAPELIHASQGGLYRHDKPEHFVEDMNETTSRIVRGTTPRKVV